MIKKVSGLSANAKLLFLIAVLFLVTVAMMRVGRDDSNGAGQLEAQNTSTNLHEVTTIESAGR